MTFPDYPQEPHAPFAQPVPPVAAGPGPGVGAEADPGFLASLGRRNPLGTLRVMALSFVVAPLLIGILVPIVVTPVESMLPPVIAYAGIAGCGMVAVAVGMAVPRPLDPMSATEQTGRAAAAAFRQAVMIRFAGADATILLGLPMAIITGSPLPYVFGLMIGLPLLVWFVLPTRGMIERARRKLEANGAISNLWTGLVTDANRPADSGRAP